MSTESQPTGVVGRLHVRRSHRRSLADARATESIMHADAREISESAWRTRRQSIHPAGTVILSRTRFGRVALRSWAWSWPRVKTVATWTSSDSASALLSVVVPTAQCVWITWSSWRQGSTHQHDLTCQIIECESECPCHRSTSRTAIVDAVWRIAGQDRQDAVLLLNSQIKLLAEHRQALITAAVTGQLEIPGAAA